VKWFTEFLCGLHGHQTWNEFAHVPVAMRVPARVCFMRNEAGELYGYPDYEDIIRNVTVEYACNCGRHRSSEFNVTTKGKKK
jgi:hypothetical protein